MTTVKELIEYLSTLPEDAEVEICILSGYKAFNIINDISYYNHFNKVVIDPILSEVLL